MPAGGKDLLRKLSGKHAAIRSKMRKGIWVVRDATSDKETKMVGKIYRRIADGVIVESGGCYLTFKCASLRLAMDGEFPAHELQQGAQLQLDNLFAGQS